MVHNCSELHVVYISFIVEKIQFMGQFTSLMIATTQVIGVLFD